ncbi:hypothetical protein FGSG_08258 [Fusarium graminearum PH-1]|uniref:Chromosome 2, complete genome n=1 Tax=Gibberella zeae (strain ATCC MYA-4620 / CBS 123657 / FGSC 9075 / NRRL 31084 / PH-1) TaxID=229533 RepID=I1RVI2_GIBZE|nr:hypothetical protein FGSG_08258 [Fusarium graminearum PH-1]ESU15119.1 hypothetical protein FGSG_08258 [Fusarium graminearum PH-1]CEF76549.1 unnamed protein product [Fusarium graminearum]|eukprot:XP_011320544.1 hypothetical protein FGSG_08258 [Fusarium graminearum PH-1]
MPGSTIESFKDAKVRKIVEYAVDLDNREVALIVFKILDEMKQFWTVQWVGYSMKEITEVLKHEIAYKPGFGDVIVKWRRSLTQMELVKVEDFPLGVDYNRRLPAWIGQPPEVECDIDMEAFENGDF